MASDDIGLTIESNLGIVQPSTPPSAPSNEFERELLTTPAIDRPSEVVIEIPTSEESESILLDTRQRLVDERQKLVDERQRLVDDMQRLVDERQRLADMKQRFGDERQALIAGEEQRWSIPKVPHRLREVKPTAYEPNAMSIGPYHYGKDHLRAMDDVKRSSFANIVENTGLQINEFVKYIKTLKERALKCYEGSIHADLIPDDKFVEMMVYDGCFIVQLIRDMRPPELVKLSGYTRTDLWYDLLVLENQIPFFVLLELDRIIAQKVGNDVEFKNASLSFFNEKGTDGWEIWSRSGTCPSPPKDIKHLLDMVHKCCRPSPQGIEQHQEYSKNKEAQESIGSSNFIRNASELENAGISFVGVNGKNLFDVTFTKHTDIKRLKIHNKVLKIPTLNVEDQTEIMLRNFTAYEQFAQWEEPTYVSDYVMLMDSLINTGKDVQLLCTSGVINNWLGDDEVVAQMFNKLGDFTHSPEHFYYEEIYDKVDKHCKGTWNIYMAKLRRDYFSSPWSLFSFLAAIILLVATLLQTVYTLISYYHPS